jgi:mRNA-degrading endonuclease toxin of MazEF toxin-antitoxin module
MSRERRLLLVMSLSDQIRNIAIEGLRRRHSSVSEEDMKEIAND